MRHRDKVVPILIVIFSVLQNRYYIINKMKKEGEKNE